jgi:multicomponent Na+:H+ antiporter subunit A
VPGSRVGEKAPLFALLALHAVVGFVVVALDRPLGRWGFACAAVPALATLVALGPQLGAVLDGVPVDAQIAWVPELGVDLVVRLDAFAALMVLVVSGIGALVCCYSIIYFAHPERGTGRLAGLLTLFAGAMLGVVVSDHLLTLFVFWELTTVTSYLLIGNDDRDARARDAALMAILVTGAGGLVMLAGFVLVGQTAGTYRMSELAGALDGADGTTISVAAVCILVGAFTKSAQFPFSAWLPGAMVAPTPISTYLHAATMVKAGVFLVARLAPALAAVDPWEPLIVMVGAFTMISGGWRALRQHDLKLLLAHGTVSQLGFMMLLFGVGAYDSAQAGAVLIVAHAAFKAALFMVVGIIDHQAGTRDVRELHGLDRTWWAVTAVSVVSAASMAGIPPMLGFLAKEKALDAALHQQVPMLAAVVVGSVLTVAYSGRFVLGVLGRLAETDRSITVPTPPRWSFVAPSLLLTAFTVGAGIVPLMIDPLISAATIALYPASAPGHLHLWAGFNSALFISAGILAVGGVAIAHHRPIEDWQRRAHPRLAVIPTGERLFWGGLTRLIVTAKRVTGVLQNGSLPIYLMVILAVAALAPLVPAASQLDRLPDPIGPWIHLPIAAIIATAAIGATVVKRRIAAALMLGAVGYAMAGLFVVQGAPDLALTQFAIETLATVMFVLVLRFLPRRFDDRRTPVLAPLRLVISAAVAVMVFVFALVAADSRDDVDQRSISDEMLSRAVPDGHGSNVVNVILVDFRGLDTLGEITVLVVAALGAVALARTTRRAGSPPDPDAGFARLPVVMASSRVLFPSIVLLSLYFLFAGHNRPGGGFVGGLTAGAAICLRYVAGGVTSVRNTFRPPPWAILGCGLGIAVGTALVPLLGGGHVLEHGLFEQTVPLVGTIKVTSALAFDIGVYLVVVGLVLMAFEAFGDDLEPDRLTLEDGGDSDRPTPRDQLAGTVES